MAADGVFSTPSDAIFWAIYTDVHGSATRGADLESGQLTTSQLSASSGKPMQISVYRSQLASEGVVQTNDHFPVQLLYLVANPCKSANIAHKMASIAWGKVVLFYDWFGLLTSDLHDCWEIKGIKGNNAIV